MTADMADVRRHDLSKAVLAAVVALVKHDRQTMAEVRHLASRLELFTEAQDTKQSA